MDQNIYIKIKKKTEVTKRKVTLSDVADISCSDKNVYHKVKECCVHEFLGKEKKQEYVGDVLAVIEAIHLLHPNAAVQSVGESDFIIDYASEHKNEKTNPFYVSFKMTVVGAIIFVGAAFSIISFHEDAAVPRTLDFIYRTFTGIEPDGPTIVNIAYSIGLTLGVIVFFNHTLKYKMTDEPTPLEVELSTYEDEVESTVIDKQSGKGEQ